MPIAKNRFEWCGIERSARYEHGYTDPADWWKLDAPISYIKPRRTVDKKSAVQTEFEQLAEQWKAETCYHSSLSVKYTHPAYQRIIGMGMAVLPFILRDLQKSPERWFYALKFISGKDPAEGAEGFEATREAWLNWGRQNNYL